MLRLDLVMPNKWSSCYIYGETFSPFSEKSHLMFTTKACEKCKLRVDLAAPH